MEYPNLRAMGVTETTGIFLLSLASRKPGSSDTTPAMNQMPWGCREGPGRDIGSPLPECTLTWCEGSPDRPHRGPEELRGLLPWSPNDWGPGQSSLTTSSLIQNQLLWGEGVPGEGPHLAGIQVGLDGDLGLAWGHPAQGAQGAGPSCPGDVLGRWLAPWQTH